MQKILEQACDGVQSATTDTISIHRVNNIEIYQSGGEYNAITVNGEDLRDIVAKHALSGVEANENGRKDLSFWGSIDIVITQHLPEAQDSGRFSASAVEV